MGCCYQKQWSGGILRLLLSHRNIDVNFVDNKGSTALSEASYHGYVDVVTLLLTSSEIDVNLGQYEVYPPLVLASSRGHIEVVSALLAHPDIDVNIMSGDDTTALQGAAECGRLEVVKLLLWRQASRLLVHHNDTWPRPSLSPTVPAATSRPTRSTEHAKDPGTSCHCSLAWQCTRTGLPYEKQHLGQNFIFIDSGE